MAKTNKARKPVVEDVLTDEDIAAAAEAIDSADDAQEEDVVAAVAEVEKKETIKKVRKGAAKKAAKKAKAKGKKKAATPKAKAAPRMSLETNAASEIINSRLASDHHALFDLDGRLKATPANLRKQQAGTLELIDGLDKKSREKAVNLFTSLANAKRPSVYTYMAAQFLKKEKQFTQKTLTDHFLEAGYKIGTARRQAGEMVSLFPAVGIASREAERGSPCIANPASKLLPLILAS